MFDAEAITILIAMLTIEYESIITKSPITVHVRPFFACSMVSVSDPPETILKALIPMKIVATGAAK